MEAHALTTTAIGCLHCGSPLAVGEKTEFCCAGCSAVYALLQSRGLNSFYRLRERTQVSSAETPAPLPQSAESLGYLDDPDFLRDYAFADGKGMRFYLEGVHCAACVWLTEKLPEFALGVASLRLDLSTGVAVVNLKEGGTFLEAAREIIKLGYRPHPVKSDEASAFRRRENQTHLKRIGVAGMATGNIMLLAAALYAGADAGLAEAFRWSSLALMIPVITYCAFPFYQGAWHALLKKKISIDVPIVFGLVLGTAASIVNLCIGSEHIYFDSLAAIVFLLLSTRYLLRKVTQQAWSAAQLMHFLAPSRARRIRVGKIEEVSVQSLKEGDLIEVLPGELFAVDGIVEHGQSSVHRALLTGESSWVPIAPGARVEAGTCNQQAPVKVRVLASGTATRLGKILSAVEQGLTQKSAIESTLDRVGQYFIFSVLILTVVGFLLGLQISWHEAINRALAIAIVVCPCTFAFATPLAFSLAIRRSAKNGLLVKGADVIERLSRAKIVFFDKTGTLTVGNLRVVDWESQSPEALPVLLALETRSAHPIARAIQEFFGRDSIADLPEVEKFSETPGVGVSGLIKGRKFSVRAHGEDASSLTVVALMCEEKVIGKITLADQIRTDSRATLNRLRKMDLKAIMLSGDATGPVREVAAMLDFGDEEAHARMSPEEKSVKVSEEAYSIMVGDGANDAVALTRASVGIAVQGGMEVSMRAADVYSAVPGISTLSGLIVNSRETMRVIRRNLVLTVFYNLVGIGFALTGALNPLFAAILMPLSAATLLASTLIGTKALRSAFAERRVR